MDFRQTSCSAVTNNIVYFGGCGSNKTRNISASYYYNSTVPLPIPLNGYHGTAYCGCGYGLDNAPAKGNNWGYSWWQGNSSSAYGYLGNGDPADLNTVQSFSQGPGTLDLSGNCTNYGFKNVTAKRQWHGRFGFTDNDNCTKDRAIGPKTFKYTSVDVSLSYYVKTGEYTFGWNSSASSWSQTDYTETSKEIATLSGGTNVDVNTGIQHTSVESKDETWGFIYDPTYPSFYRYDVTQNTTNGSGSLYDGIGVCPRMKTYGYGVPEVGDGYLTPPECNDNIALIADWIGADYVEYSDGFTLYSQSIAANPNNSVSFSWTGLEWWAGNPDTGAEYFQKLFSGGYIIISSSIANDTYYFQYSRHGIMDPGNPFAPTSLIYTDIDIIGSFSLSGNNSSSALVAQCESLLANWDLGNNVQYPWRTDSNYFISPLMANREVPFNVAPAPVKNRMQDWRNPIGDNNNNSPFTTPADPPPYGWTYAPDNNDNCGNGTSSMDYTGPSNWQETYAGMDWRDPNDYWWKWTVLSGSLNTQLASSIESTHMDGLTIGAPGYISGSLVTEYFDFNYHDWRFCKTPDGCSGNPYQEYTYAYGGALSDAAVSNEGNTNGAQFSTFLPIECTHWINNEQSHGIPKGASVGSEMLYDGSISATKWAEVRLPLPSYNFFRPCAADRVTVDETNTTAFVDESLTMYNQLVGLSSTSYVLIYNSNGYDGIYTGCSQTPSGDFYTLTLGPLVQPLPLGYSHWYTDLWNDGISVYGMVGIMRFPTAWSICGRTSANTSAAPSGSTYLNFAQNQPYIWSGDSVTLYDHNMASLGAYTLTTGSSLQQFIISHPYSGSLINTIWVTSAGAPDWHWNDTTPKNQFRMNSWYESYRTSSLNFSGSCIDGCVVQSPCHEAVVCLSPNVESFASGSAVSSVQRYWFGPQLTGSMSGSVAGSFLADGVYGSILQQNVEFSMSDPLWQKPANPPDPLGLYGRSYAQDDGNCQNDTPGFEGATTIFYPPPPYVEALCSVPDGAPALPAGVSFPTAIAPWVPLPPGNGLLGFYTQAQDWVLAVNESAQNATCRFAPYYQWLGGLYGM